MSQSSRSIGIGIIGCGTIAERMIRAWRPHMRHAHLAAVSDVSADRTQHFRIEFGIKNAFSDHHELLKSADVDAVLVLTPNFLHAPQSIDAMKAGKHVLCQKPMAMNVAEAKSMVDTAAETGVTLMAAYVKRFWPCKETH